MKALPFKMNKTIKILIVILSLAILAGAIFGLVKTIKNKQEFELVATMQESDYEIYSEEEININELEEYVPEENNSAIDIEELTKNEVTNSNKTNNKNNNVSKKSGKKYYIKVNYGANVVTIYTKDEEGNYTVPVKAMVCSTRYSDT